MHAIAFLDFEVFAVRLSDIGCRKALEIVSIEENRHELLPLRALEPIIATPARIGVRRSSFDQHQNAKTATSATAEAKSAASLS